MTFGEKLKEIRKTKGDSLRKTAEQLGIAFSYLDRIEKGEVPISKNVFEKAIQLFPLEEVELTKTYLEEYLPDSVQQIIGVKIKDSFLNDMKNIIKMLDEEEQKLVFMYVIERLEVTALKKGNYDKVKSIIAEAKEKINS